MIQQMANERAQLEAESNALHKKLDEANAQVAKLGEQNDSLKKQLDRSRSSLDQSSAANKRNEETISQLRNRMNELIAEFRKTANTLRETEMDRNRLRKSLTAREGDLKQCVDNDMALYKIGNEVLDRYEHKGVFESLREREPFTKIKRVQLENLVDEYHWKLDDELLPAAKAKARGQNPTQAGPSGDDAQGPPNSGQ